MILTVTLNPAVDLNLQVPDWAPGEVNRTTAVTSTAGGKGINVSRVLQRLGVVTTALTILGAESAEKFKRLSADAKLPIIYVSRPGEVRTNIHLTDPASGRLLKINQPGPELSPSTLEHFILLYRQQLKRSRWVAIGGSLPPGCPVDAYARLVALARTANVPVLIDAEGEPLLAALAEKPTIAKPNAKELCRTLNVPLQMTHELIDSAAKLQDLGAENVIVSSGSSRVYGLEQGAKGEVADVWEVTPPRVTVSGTTGAGDSLAGGLLAAIHRGDSFSKALAFGVACASATCANPEGVFVTREEASKLLKRTRLTKHT
jgi:tagatose 6-phosphate kinase